MNPSDAYRQTASAYVDVKANLLNVSQRLTELANGLMAPDRTYIPNGEAIYPPEVTNNGNSLDASTLPSINDLAAMLSRYHQLRTSLVEHWERVPAHERASLKSPQDLGASK